MKLKCKNCEHEMILLGMPTYVQWICEKCLEPSDNYDADLKEQEIYIIKDRER